MSEIIQLTIWDKLGIATTNSIGADFLGLLTEVDQSIEQLVPAERLGAAGEAILRLGEIYASRSALQLCEIEYLFRPEQEPVMSLDAFNGYVRQSMLVDLEQFIEAPELPEYEREYNLTMVREISKAEVLAEIAAFEEIDPEAAYHTAIALAHDENVSEWGAMISARLGELERESSDEVQVSISLLELQRAIDLPLIQVWLGLLLNEFAIEQRGEFYDTENIWIRAIISSRPDTCS